MNNTKINRIFKPNKKLAKKNFEYVPIIVVVNGMNDKLAKTRIFNHNKGMLRDFNLKN